MSLSAERKDSRQNNPRRPSRLGVPAVASSASIHRSAFETVDELDDLDGPTPPRKASRVSIVAHGSAGRDMAVARRLSRPASASGNANPAFETVDELDDLDRVYRKASMAPVNVPSRRVSRAAQSARDAKEEKEYYFKKRCTRTTKVLVTLCIVFFLLAEIMVSVYLMERYKDPPPQVCQSDSCINFGRLLKSSINVSADPCKDFYAFSCGNFQHMQPYGDRYRDMDDLIKDELAVRMNDILKRLKSDNGKSKQDYEKKASQFHHLCMDLNTSSVRESIVQVLQNLGWPLLSPAGTPHPPLPQLLKEAHQHGISALFHVSRLRNAADPGNPHWTVEEGTLPFPNPVYDSEKRRVLYGYFIRDLVNGLQKDLNGSQSVTQADYQKIVEFESELAGVSHEPLYFKLSIGEFSRSYPNIARLYDFTKYFRTLAQSDYGLDLLSSNVTTNVSSDTIIILKNRDYFQTLNQGLGSHVSDRDQAVYVGWRILLHYVGLMDEEPQFWSIIQGFWKTIGFGGTEQQAHWKKCAQLAIEALPDGGLALYRDRYFLKEQTDKIDLLLDKLTTGTVELLNKQEWLTDTDRATAELKFNKLIRQMPYSEELYSQNLTNVLYSKGVITYDSFFLTLRSFQRVRQHFVIAGVYNTPIEYTDMLGFAFGADYRLDSHGHGIIGVFPKTLTPPFYDVTLPKYAQYSTLGFQYAQELAHVIDYEWFMLNKTSEADGGPSNTTFQQYHAKLGHLLELYRNTSILLQLPVDPETLYEDSADQAALRIAYRAYQDVIRAANDGLLPGFPYDMFDFPQMFFLTFAQYFCLNDQSSRVKDPSRIGFSHPRVRLTAMVTNSEEFDTAFQCGKMTTPGQQLLQIPDPPRKIKYRPNTTAKQIDEWYHWFDRKPGLPTWSKAW